MLVDVIKSSAHRIYSATTKVLPGGYELKDSSVPVGSVIEKGTLVSISGKQAHLVACGIVLADSTEKLVRVGKNHYFHAGDVVVKEGSEATATISSIDTSSEKYDVLTLSKNYTGLVANDVLLISGVSKPNAVTSSDVIVGEQTTLDVACEGIIYKYNYVLPASWLTGTGLCLAENHGIVFI